MRQFAEIQDQVTQTSSSSEAAKLDVFASVILLKHPFLSLEQSIAWKPLTSREYLPGAARFPAGVCACPRTFVPLKCVLLFFSSGEPGGRRD